MEEEMQLEAEALRFENAAMLRNRLNELRRLFDRRSEVSTSVTHNNTIIILDANSREKTVEVFLFDQANWHIKKSLEEKPTSQDFM